MRVRTIRFGSTAKVLAECKLKYYKISECSENASMPCPCSCFTVDDANGARLGRPEGLHSVADKNLPSASEVPVMQSARASAPEL